MYQQYFNFTTAPFSIAPDPHFIYMSEHHKEGLAHLLYGIKQGGGFVALTGEVGTGKTTLCHCLLQQLPDNIAIALVLNPKLSALELLATICDELHIAYDENKQTLKGLIDKLNRYLLETHATGKRTVLIIDEAQNLSLDVLEQVRLLTNLETSKTKLLQIILLGQPELKQLLEQHQLRQLNQRITARYHLTSLSFVETKHYINHRLAVCGSQHQIFSQSAIKKIYKLSNGIPRLINILCDRALLGAYATNQKTVNTKIIRKAAKEVFNPLRVKSGANKKLLLGFVFIILVTASLFFNSLVQPEKQKIDLVEEKIAVVEDIVFEPVQEIAEVILEPEPEVDLSLFLQQQDQSLNSKISILAKRWGISVSDEIDCEEIKQSGLRCLLDKSDWKSLVALNRPVILEFTNTESEKKYLQLIALNKGKPVFSEDSETVFPLEQVLALWDGYFLMLWQPVVDSELVYPGQSSPTVLWIRKQMALFDQALQSQLQSPFFDQALKTAVIQFQQTYHLSPDGIVGPRSFIHLQNNDPENKSPLLELNN